MRNVWLAGLLALVAAFTACDKGNPNADLLKAVEEGRLQQVRTLIEKGVDVDARDDFERTPLMLSAFGGHQEIASALLKAGADIHAKAKYGQTALQFAVERGNDAIVALLKAAGADS